MTLERLKISLAVWLCRGSTCAVVRTLPVQEMQMIARDLTEYVQASGGLQDPHRINAYRRVLYDATHLEAAARQVIVSPRPILLLREESHAPDEKTAAPTRAAV